MKNTIKRKTIYDLNETARAYLECAAWSSNDESTPQGGEPFDNMEGWRDLLAPDVIETAEKVCADFTEANRDSLADWEAGQIGHDLWLTRNGHGAGFWDRDFGTKEARKALTDAAHALGEVNMYLGDDGKIYIS